MKDLPHAGLPEKESTVPGPYGQCMTLIARGDIGQNFKIRGGPMCKFLQDLCIFWLLWIPFVGLNGSKSSGKIDIKYVSGAIYFWFLEYQMK